MLFIHREDNYIYGYGDRVSFKCDLNRNIVESARTSVSLVNDFGHRYPAYPHGDSWYAGYRSNNRVYKLNGL